MLHFHQPGLTPMYQTLFTQLVNVYTLPSSFNEDPLPVNIFSTEKTFLHIYFSFIITADLNPLSASIKFNKHNMAKNSTRKYEKSYNNIFNFFNDAKKMPFDV